MKTHPILLLILLLPLLAELAAKTAFTILHINDHHSHLEPTAIDLELGGKPTRIQLGGFAEIATLIGEEQTRNPNTLLLHAGDALTGTIYYSLFKGKSDAEVMNRFRWDAFVLGNHEFDDGDQGLKNFLDLLDPLRVPVTAANVVPAPGNILSKSWQPYLITEVNGRRVGIIGIDIVGKTRNSSNPGSDIRFLDEIETASRYTDELTRQGVNIVIVLTHIGHKNALALASRVKGVDVVVAGDSHSLLGTRGMIRDRIPVEGTYPVMVTGRDGNPAAVVQAWEYAKLLGVLDVTFDDGGILQSAQGRPVFPLADSFLRKNFFGNDKELAGSARKAVYADIGRRPYLRVTVPDPKVKAIIDKYRAEKDRIGKVPVGRSLALIPGGSKFRIPFWDRDRDKDGDKDNDGGTQQSHEVAQLAAEAGLDTLRGLGRGNVNAMIQNAGGVRIPIKEGDITTEDIFTLLPFGNTLVTLKMSGSEIRSTLEDSIDYALNPQGSTGSFPYAAGLRYTVDLKAEKGSRVSEIEIKQDDWWAPLDPDAPYQIGVNSYIADGRDGYDTLERIDPARKVNTYLDYAEAMVRYIKKVKEIGRPEEISVTLKR